MYTYFNYEDLSITLLPNGSITFNKELIYRKMSKRFVMPQWIKQDLDKILDDSIFQGVVNVNEAHKIVNSKVVELNNKLVPLARSKAIKNSALAELIDFTKLYSGMDIALLIPYIDVTKGSFASSVLVDIERVFLKLEHVGLVLNESERTAMKERVFDLMEKLDKEYSNWQVVNNERISAALDEIRTQIVIVINSYLLDISSDVSLRYMLDTQGLTPYFVYNHGDDGISYDKERIYYLMSAMGYSIDFGGDSEVDAYIAQHVSEMEEELIAVENMELDKDTLSNISITINLSLLNRLKFVSDNNIPFELAKGLRYPEVLVSQLELEGAYVDTFAEMMTYDNILNDLNSTSGIPKAECHEYVTEIINELKDIFKSVKEANESIEVIYKCVYRSYDNLIDVKSKSLRKKFTRPTNNMIVDKTHFGSSTMQSTFFK